MGTIISIKIGCFEMDRRNYHKILRLQYPVRVRNNDSINHEMKLFSWYDKICQKRSNCSLTKREKNVHLHDFYGIALLYNLPSKASMPHYEAMFKHRLGF